MPRLKRGEANTSLLVVAALRGVADDGLLILAREVTDGSGLFVGDEVSLSRSDHHDDDDDDAVSAMSGVGARPRGHFKSFHFDPSTV